MTFYWYTPLLMTLWLLCTAACVGWTYTLVDAFKNGGVNDMVEAFCVVVFLFGTNVTIMAVRLGVGFDCTATR